MMYKNMIKKILISMPIQMHELRPDLITIIEEHISSDDMFGKDKSKLINYCPVIAMIKMHESTVAISEIKFYRSAYLKIFTTYRFREDVPATYNDLLLRVFLLAQEMEKEGVKVLFQGSKEDSWSSFENDSFMSKYGQISVFDNYNKKC